MTDPDQASGRPGANQRHRMPRWVIGFIIAGVVLVALVVLMLALGHGPQQHVPSHTSLPALAVPLEAWF